MQGTSKNEIGLGSYWGNHDSTDFHGAHQPNVVLSLLEIGDASKRLQDPGIDRMQVLFGLVEEFLS
jgi:hypothetical protein